MVVVLQERWVFEQGKACEVFAAQMVVCPVDQVVVEMLEEAEVRFYSRLRITIDSPHERSAIKARMVRELFVCDAEPQTVQGVFAL